MSLRDYKDDTMLLRSVNELVTEFRPVTGSLQFVAGISRPEVLAATLLLHGSFDELNVGTLKEVRRTLRYVRATAADGVVLLASDPKEWLITAFGDAAWANAWGARSQAGMIIALAEEWATKERWPASLGVEVDATPMKMRSSL